MAEHDEQEDWNKVLSGGLSVGGIDSVIPSSLAGAEAVQHAEDAVDYEDEDELADDEDLDLAVENDDKRESSPAADINVEDTGDDLNDILGEGAVDGDQGDEDGYTDWSKGLADEIKREEEQEKLFEGGYESDGDLDDAHHDEPSDFEMDDDEKSGPFDNELLDENLLNEINDTMNDNDLLKLYYPGFEPGIILSMNSIFGPKAATLVLPKPRPVRQFVPVKPTLEVDQDQKDVFRGAKRITRYDNAISNNIQDSTVVIGKSTLDAVSKQTLLNSTGSDSASNSDSEDHLIKDLGVVTADWHENLWSSDSDEEIGENNHQPPAPEGIQIFRGGDIYNSEEEEAFFDGSLENIRSKVQLDLNDSNLLFVEDSLSSRSGGPAQKMIIATKRSSAQIPTDEKQLQSRYNISNDRAYDLLKENYQSKVRSTIGNLNIDHSMVALRLQSPHYKVKLSKAQMRSFHRPSFVVKPNTVIHFSKPKQRKKKRDKGRRIVELLARTSDLTLGDSAQFFLLEYSEEFPLALSNFGMGSKLINYYRKKSAEDTARPKLPTGETHVLSVQDRSAFWNFGFVEPGNVVPTLYNRMIRAPIFRHDVKSTDFILIRSTGGGLGQKYFLRTIPHLFVVGQTFPVTVIPGPHSRKVTTASKNRLKMVVYRVLNQNDHQRLLVKDISAHFPDQNDMQNRQRLKEFMEYQRAGDDQGYWKIKATDSLPSEDAIRSMITPEDITLLEAMQVGQQHLEDAGYGKTVEDDEDQDGMSTEEQLAPWNVSRNFINATQGKAMLQLHGEGDPSGRGEAFSFLRTSMKGGFKAIGESVNDKLDKSKYGGHSYNVAMQQKAYDEEIARIWYSQKRSLMITDREDLKWDDAEAERDNPVTSNGDDQRESNTPAGDDDNISLFSHISNNPHHNKVLRITRFVKDENGTVQRKVEVVKDPNVIRAYVKRRQNIEDSQMAPDEIAPTDDKEKNKRKRKILEEELARLQRNQDRRLARKAMKAGTEPGQQLSGKGIGKGKSTTRKCATCGAIGHIRTNKSCPMYNETYGSGGDLPIPSPAPQG